MILGAISLIDCLVFLIFLIPQLILQVGFLPTAICGLSALPYLLLKMPYQLFRERLFTPYSKRTPLTQHCSWFTDLVMHCVRYAFAYIPAHIGAVFFSKPVALPFMRWRMLRHGYRRCPLHFEEISIPLPNPTNSNDIYSYIQKTDAWTRQHRRKNKQTSVRAIYIVTEPSQPPDMLVYYLHGGGFAMGSSYFYLEFLLAWASLLKSRGIARNPAVLALEYTLVPTATYPTQLRQARAGYEEAVRRVADGDPERVCVAGDSAGATLGLSLLLALAKEEDSVQERVNGARIRPRPGFATMISPWCSLVSPMNRNTPSDYLNAESLHLYARQYLGSKEDMLLPGVVKERKTYDASKEVNGTYAEKKWMVSEDDGLASPGKNVDLELWKRATPVHGWHFVYGAEEVFGPETRVLADRLEAAGAKVVVDEEPAAVHAWPVVNLFLGDETQERLKGLIKIVDGMGRAINAGKS